MSGRLSDNKIAMYLDVFSCSVRQVRSHFRDHGTIPDANQEESAQEGCRNNQQLQDIEVEVGIKFVRTTTILTIPVSTKHD